MDNKKDLVQWEGRLVHKSAPARLTAEQQFTHFQTRGGKRYQRIRYEGEHGNTCGDCGTKVGWIHDDGCDCEMCPKCGGQLLSCDCQFSHKSGVKA